MGKVKVNCSWCGKTIERYPSQLAVNKNNYCSSSCRSAHLSKSTNPEGYAKHPHLSQYNQQVNKTRMTEAVREKIRNSRIGKGEGKTYTKVFGRHEHRIVAEQMLGRPLKRGEVVHHINRDKRDNRPENLMIFSSQAEHVAWHNQHDAKGGDAL